MTKENYTTGAVTVNQIIIIIYKKKNNPTTNSPEHCMTMGCKHSPQVIIQVLIIPPVHYAEQSFSFLSHCNYTVTLLSAVTNHIDHRQSKCHACCAGRAKRFSQWPITLPACCVCLYSLRSKERLNQFTYMQWRVENMWQIETCFLFSLALRKSPQVPKRPREVSRQVTNKTLVASPESLPVHQVLTVAIINQRSCSPTNYAWAHRVLCPVCRDEWFENAPFLWKLEKQIRD